MKIIGHRGAKGLAPENTLASFAKALECGVDAVELDVHLTSDGILAVAHDPALITTDGKEFSIAHHSYSQLVALQPDLTTLEAVIIAINHRVPIVIEVKVDSATQSVIECVQGFLAKGWQMQDFEFCSFAQAPLVRLRQAFPQAELIPNESWQSLRACWRAHRLGSRRISLKQKWLWRGFLRSMQRRGWKVSSYTINDPARAQKWRPYLYALYTDRPDLIN